MNEKDKIETTETEPETTKEFTLDEFDLNPLSSAETIKTGDSDADIILIPEDEPTADAEADVEENEVGEIDPIFAELAVPKLPELQRENRAWLQMQSPNRIYFYWSIKNNPYRTLGKVLNGQESSYQLVAKFTNSTSGYEQMFPVETEGNYWYNAESNSQYQAEIGFYATNRPYFRIMYSNPLDTPRKTPSPRQATDADWAISAAHFAEVLDNSGFTRDAFEVALAGDDEKIAQNATQNALLQFLGLNRLSFDGFNHEEVRFVLLALASGVSLDHLRGQISEALFSVLQENLENITPENAQIALQEHFDVLTEDVFEEESTGAAVYGASLVNFPKSMRKRTVPKTLAPKDKSDGDSTTNWTLSPISSFKSGK